MSLALTRGADGIATIWPSSGVSVAALLLATPRQRWAVLVAVAAGSLIANYEMGTPFVSSLGFTLANTVEPVIAVVIMRHISGHEESFYSLRAVCEFCLAAIVAAACSSVLASLFVETITVHFFVSWISTVSLGILIVTPAILSMMRNSSLRTRGALQRQHRMTPAFVTMAVAAITLGVFLQTTYPLLFLPLVAVIFATYLLGARGAIFSVFLIAIVGSLSTWLGLGPIHLISAYGESAPVLFFQFYLLTLLLSAMPLAALLNTRQRDFETMSRTTAWLEMSEAFSKVGHWRVNLTTQALYWSNEVYSIHGLPQDQLPALNKALDFYHPEDRPGVQQQITETIETGEPFEFDARLLRADGSLRYVHSRGEIEQDDNGKPAALFGIFQDVTERVMANMQLAEARKRAETEARLATELSQTDPLTEVANRRKSMDVLDFAFDQARALSRPLSVAILDIDHFKTVNDTLGHASGDTVIRTVAQVCQQALRSSDLVGRIGGEEFILILPGADLTVAKVIIERVRQAIEQIDWAPMDLALVTASIGVSTLHGQPDYATMLQEADKALYRAKQTGRNRLCQAA